MRADIEGAERARRYQVLFGWPEKSDFNTHVNNNLLLNCNITTDDINRAHTIYGEATSILQDKMMSKKPIVHSKTEKTFTSSNTRETQKHTPLHGFFYVNGLIFLHTRMGKINFLSVKSLTSRQAISFIKSLEEKYIYMTQEFSR